jgi:glutamate carboxypeptidase
MDTRSARLFEAVESCGKQLGMNLEIHPSGGTCDGNRLAAAGLPVVDSLGPCGGHLHSEQEYLLIDSLPQRAKLTALLLLGVGAGEFQI